MYSDVIFTCTILDIVLQNKQNFLLYKSAYSLNHQNFKNKTYLLGLGYLQSQLVQNLWLLYLHFHHGHLKFNEYNNFTVYIQVENSSLFINFELEIHWAKENIEKKVLQRYSNFQSLLSRITKITIKSFYPILPHTTHQVLST